MPGQKPCTADYAGRSGDTDQIEALEVRDKALRKVRREYLDVIVREDQVFSAGLCDAAVVTLRKRSSVSNGDDFMGDARKQAPVVRSYPTKLCFVDTADNNRELWSRCFRYDSILGPLGAALKKAM